MRGATRALTPFGKSCGTSLDRAMGTIAAGDAAPVEASEIQTTGRLKHADFRPFTLDAVGLAPFRLRPAPCEYGLSGIGGFGGIRGRRQRLLDRHLQRGS